MQVISVDLAFDGEVGCIEALPRGSAPITMNPSAVDTNTKRVRKKTEKGPTVAVSDKVSTFAGMLGDCKVRDYGFIRNGGIIKRERSGKKSITGDTVGVCRMRVSEYCQRNNEPAREHIPPLSRAAL
jgi:hypothetical protein